MKSTRTILIAALALMPAFSRAQSPTQYSPGMLPQLQIQQAPVDVSADEKISVATTVSPASVRPGEKAFYRVAVGAIQEAIEWPENISAQTGLRLANPASGQISRMEGNRFRPLTMFVYEVTAAAPGRYVISNFVVRCNGRPVEIPAATVEIKVADVRSAPRLQLLATETNVYLGQPFRVRVAMPAGPGNRIEALREVQFNGSGFALNKSTVRQSVESLPYEGALRPAFVYEAVVTPIGTGRLRLSAQAFTAGGDLGGPIVITSQVNFPGGPPEYILQTTEPVAINVRALPTESERRGFTGAIGDFVPEEPVLSTNRVRIGEPLHLKFNFLSAGNLNWFVPPEMPRSRDWQIIPDSPPGNGCTFIPLTDEVTHTPAIPFSSFDPERGEYVDLTIPAQAVAVFGEGLPTQLPDWNDNGRDSQRLKLSLLATAPGKTVSSLKPPQSSVFKILLLLLPVYGLVILWQWDNHRRFLAAHPEILRRRNARRALRKVKLQLRRAVAASDGMQFVQQATAALRIAVSPHFPAEPRALVCGDVLSQLDAADANATGAVRKLFAAADSEFAQTPDDLDALLTLHGEIETVLLKLEAKL